MDPTAGELHVTPVLGVPLTLAKNAVDWPLVIDIHDGVSEILTVGIRLTVAVSTGAEGALAVIVTWVVAVMLAGAAYCPRVDMVPKLGLMDQV
jgi:hypothetical protein